MLVFNLVVFIFAISPAVGSVARQRNYPCSGEEFTCSDGACVGAGLVCDGNRDCVDGSDEAVCFTGTVSANQTDIIGLPVLHRHVREAAKCADGQWQCRDGTCIAFDGKCDGTVDCPDRSDETFPLCRLSECQPNWFRCTYGACVDGTAPCNGITECADGSDELLPQCRNEIDEENGQFECEDGTIIPATDHCDGVLNCPDGSDETLRTCADKTCPFYVFQCEYGACVDEGSDCNGKSECADSSDESDELCHRKPGTGVVKKPARQCVLPPYPEHGTYVVSGAPNARPGQDFISLNLNVSCNDGYGVIGDTCIFCQGGTWSLKMPQCVRFCKLDSHPSVHYHCLVSGTIQGQRACNAYEPSGTVVQPECNAPNYYSAVTLNYMHCIEGNWDYVATCNPECGRVTPEGTGMIINGHPAKRGELPWHASIYRRTPKFFMQICGGSLVSNSVVISAAHCFWLDVGKKQPAANYAVAVGKIYRRWHNVNDDNDAQRSEVREIHIPERFDGSAANYQDDIAVLIMASPFVYRTYVRPVCLDFGVNFERKQLQAGNLGKVAGWGLMDQQGGRPNLLSVADLPYVDIRVCISSIPRSFREYITSDKICAGYTNGTAVCHGDSGGGLAFPEMERGTERFYLRGIVSTAPVNKFTCNTQSYTTFTQITTHEKIIKDHLTLGTL